MFVQALSDLLEQTRADERRIAMCGPTNSHGRYGYGRYGVQRRSALESAVEGVVFVNVVQNMVSQCKSAKSALIRVRLFCVPPKGTPLLGGALVTVLPFPVSVTPGATEAAVPWNSTRLALSCAGANNIKTVGLVILSADIATLFA